MAERDRSQDVEPGTERWRISVGDSVECSPTVVGDTLYVHSTDGTICALDTDSGAQQWVFEVDLMGEKRPVVAEGTVYLSSFRTLYAVDESSGEEQWHVEFGDAITTAPKVVDEVVYVGTTDATPQSNASTLYAVDAETGAEQWRVQDDNDSFPSPTVSNGIVYVGGVNGGNTLSALDAATGAELWQFETHGPIRSGGIGASPLVVAGFVYVYSHDGHLYAVDARDGTERWQYRTNSGLSSPPTVADDTVFFGSGNTLHAIDVGTGTGQWSLAVDDDIQTKPTVADGVVYAGSNDTTVFAVDATTGRGRWRFKTGDMVRTAPIVREGTVYIGSDDGTVYALDAARGDEQWRYTTGDLVDAVPTLVGDTLYVGSRDGHVYALAVAPPGSTTAPPLGDTDARLTTPDGSDPAVAAALEAVGYDTLQALRSAAQHELAAIPAVGWGTAARIKHAVGQPTGRDTESTQEANTAADGNAGVAAEEFPNSEGFDESASPDSKGPSAGERSRDVPFESGARTDPGEIRWQFEAGGPVKSSPIIDGDTVYAGGADLYALDVATGRQRWCFENAFANEWFAASPVVADGTVYSGSLDGYVYAVNARDGTEQWRFRVGGIIDTALAVGNGSVYVSTDALYAIDTDTGEEQWCFDPVSWVNCSPTVVDDTVYVGTDGGHLYAIDAQTGAADQIFELTASSELESVQLASPTVADGTIFVGSIQGTVHAIDLETGSELWQFTTVGKVTAQATVSQGTVYVGDQAKRLYALDAATGEERWRFDTKEFFSSGFHAAPTVSHETVYAGAGDALYAVGTETGEERWRVETGDDIRTTSAVAFDTVFFGSNDEHVYAVAASPTDDRR